MNFEIARTRPEVGRLLFSQDGIKCCKISSLGVTNACSAFEEKLSIAAQACERQNGCKRSYSDIVLRRGKKTLGYNDFLAK